MKKEKSCGAIVEFNGKILIVQQKKSGNYGFPKGHCLPEESEEETAIREVKEETNVDIEINNKKGIHYLTYRMKKLVKKWFIFLLNQ